MFRRVLSFIAVVGVAFLWACDNGSDGEPNNSLVGTWAVTAFSAEVGSSTTFDNETIEVSATISGSNLDYTITFTDSDFSTSGGYTTNTTANIDGQQFEAQSITLTNVTGSGAYTATASEITVGSSFFSLEVNGVPFETGGAPQTVSYTINGNQLVFSQNEAISFTEQGITSTVTIVQSSTWTRQ